MFLIFHKIGVRIVKFIEFLLCAFFLELCCGCEEIKELEGMVLALRKFTSEQERKK